MHVDVHYDMRHKYREFATSNFVTKRPVYNVSVAIILPFYLFYLTIFYEFDCQNLACIELASTQIGLVRTDLVGVALKSAFFSSCWTAEL